MDSHHNSSPEMAVNVCHCFHVYRELFGGSKRVLNDFNMSVEKGTIYALLGSSGCGKTTVIRALVGQHRLTAGEVRVLGHRVGRRLAGLPAGLLGYMPQEVGLPSGLTIAEVLRFYAMLAGTPSADIPSRVRELAAILDLPDVCSIIGTLSGGQQRRVSFAVALVGKPPLLILDEPTVGLDPLLRSKIWETLLDLTSSQGTTILLTTHYVDEARQAHTVGLVRHGRLLVEEDPTTLMTRHGSSNLEEAVVQLCMEQEQLQQDDLRLETQAPVPAQSASLGKAHRKWNRRKSDPSIESSGSQRVPKSPISALIWKHCINVWRNKWAIMVLSVLTMLLPVVTETIQSKYPSTVVGVVNEDADCGAQHPADCSQEGLSCRFLSYLPARDVMTVQYSSVDEAEQAVRSGRAWGALHFQHNFSSCLVERNENAPWTLSNYTIEHSSIIARLDMSNVIVSTALVRRLSEAMTDLVSTLTCDSDLGGRDPRDPMNLQVVFGSKDNTNNVDQRPQMILGTMFLFGGSLALIAIMTEVEEKALERSIVAGVTRLNLLFSVLAVYTPILFIVVGIFLVAFFIGLATPCQGSLWLVYAITVIFTVFSFLFGIIVTLISPSFTIAGVTVQMAFQGLSFLSGSMWPYEGMHWTAKPVAWVMPMLMPALTLRGVLMRGWGLEHPQVLFGFGVALLCCVVGSAILLVWAFHPTRWLRSTSNKELKASS